MTSFKLVDPFFAVNSPGNCLIGPYQPLGLVRLGPETENIGWEVTGYRTGEPIKYFTHTHVNGAGGNGRLGNIGVMPFVAEEGTDPCSDLPASPITEETAALAYYSATLTKGGIGIELTATQRVGVHRFRFPGEANACIRFDAAAVVKIGTAAEGEQMATCVDTHIERISAVAISGYGTFQGGWGHNYPYTVYFYAVLDRDAQWLRPSEDSSFCIAQLGAQKELNLRVGVSFVSMEKAGASIQREAPVADFEAIRERSLAEWEPVLNKINIESTDTQLTSLFYTMLYRLFCMPTDLGIDDENHQWKSGVRQFSEIICLWDSVRNANSLLTLIAPDLQRDILNALIDIGDHRGWIPDAWVNGHSAQIQGGSSADILFCEAKLKGLVGVDYEKALAHMVHNASAVSPDPKLHGRYLEDYNNHGFVADDVINCVSRHIEYSYHDHCISTLAKELGESETAQAFSAQSKRLWNLWNDELKHFAPRSKDGEWIEEFNPQTCRPDCWNDPYFYEGTSSQWSYSTHHDFPGLITRCGGAEAFVERLDDFFYGREKGVVAGGYCSKETMLHVPYLYINAGRPDKTQACVHHCLKKHFKPGRTGLSDNEDMGCQSSFFICSILGLYPVMGQDLYWLSTPGVERIKIPLGDAGNTLTITAPGAGGEMIYIASATLNGKPLDRAWLRHSETSKGADLHFILSDKPTQWGATNLPPAV